MYKPYDDKRAEAETPASLDEVGRVLMKAAEIIRERGWCQNRFEDSAGRVCAMGALKVAAGMPADIMGAVLPPAAFKARDRLQNHLNGRGPHKWNDDADRTADEVIAALESAALARAVALRDGDAK